MIVGGAVESRGFFSSFKIKAPWSIADEIYLSQKDCIDINILN
jgi:hypothetical protein